MLMTTSLARAKINLTLHAGHVNSRGYHPLHSLVVFADIGDTLSAKISDRFSLEIEGPFAKDLSNGTNNLVFKAAKSTAIAHKIQTKLAYTLIKNLPVSSGIGGGSADAAAAVRLLGEFSGEGDNSLGKHLIEIGADVPVCFKSKTCLLKGIGEKLTPLSNLGQVAAVLINPGVSVSTVDIFKDFDSGGSSSNFKLSGSSLLEMASSGRNDLQSVAVKNVPVIQMVLEQIQGQNGCNLARMSGSGATCFGLFEDLGKARNAAVLIQKKHPNWWCVPTMLGDISI